MLYEINYKSDNSRLLDKKNSTKVCELTHTNNDIRTQNFGTLENHHISTDKKREELKTK